MARIHANWLQRRAAIFHQLDKDGDGYLSAAEWAPFAKVLCELGLNWHPLPSELVEYYTGLISSMTTEESLQHVQRALQELCSERGWNLGLGLDIDNFETLAQEDLLEWSWTSIAGRLFSEKGWKWGWKLSADCWTSIPVILGGGDELDGNSELGALSSQKETRAEERLKSHAKHHKHVEHLQNKKRHDMEQGRHGHGHGHGHAGHSHPVVSAESHVETQASMPADGHHVARDQVIGARKIVSKAYCMELPPSDEEADEAIGGST